MIYQADKTLKEFADKISEDEKQKIEQAKQDLQEAVKGKMSA